MGSEGNEWLTICCDWWRNVVAGKKMSAHCTSNRRILLAFKRKDFPWVKEMFQFFQRIWKSNIKIYIYISINMLVELASANVTRHFQFDVLQKFSEGWSFWCNEFGLFSDEKAKQYQDSNTAKSMFEFTSSIDVRILYLRNKCAV